MWQSFECFMDASFQNNCKLDISLFVVYLVVNIHRRWRCDGVAIMVGHSVGIIHFVSIEPSVEVDDFVSPECSVEIEGFVPPEYGVAILFGFS